MSTLFTLVGQQPGAVAATALALFRHRDLTRMIVLSQDTRREEITRLVRFMNERTNGRVRTDVRCVSFDPAATAEAGVATAWGFMESIIDQTVGEGPFYYDTSPGPNYQVGLIAHNIARIGIDKRIIPIHAQTGKIRSLAPFVGQLNLAQESIDLDALLDLHGYPPNLKGLPNTLCLPTGKSGFTFTIEYPFELHGRLYGIKTVSSMEDARELAAVLSAPRLLNYLRPVLAVAAADSDEKRRLLSARRLQLYGVSTIDGPVDSENPALSAKEIIDLLTTPPGSFAPGPDEKAIKLNPEGFFSTPAPEESDADGPNLIAVLGRDPSATLLALTTHKPKTAVILVDGSKWIMTLAHRLAAHEPPCGQLHFVKTDIWGEIAKRDFFDGLLRNSRWICNLSPGTKAQTWMMGCLVAQQTGKLELWSLNNETRHAQRLDGKGSVRFDLPPLLSAANINGGDLRKDGRTLADIKRQKEFLVMCSKVIGQSVWDETKINLVRKNGTPANVLGAGVRVVSKKGFLECLDANTMRFRVCIGKKCKVGTLRGRPDKWHWLEEIVAGAFLAEGGSKIREMAVGIEWSWLHPENRGDPRAEIDIAMRWEDHYVCVSVKKSGRYGADPTAQSSPVLQHGLSIMAETRVGFGRFALPVLTRGGISKEHAEGIANASLDLEPLELGLSLMVYPRRRNLVSYVERAFRQRRSLK